MKINLGAGPNILNGYLNLDLYPSSSGERYGTQKVRCDLKNGLPLFDAFNDPIRDIELITSCHFFEHLSHADGLKLMKHCHEKLKEGGIFRLALPNFRTMILGYLNEDWDFFDLVAYTAPNHQIMEIINAGLYQDIGTPEAHLCMYDIPFAVWTLQQAGFKNVKEVPYDNSIEPDWEIRRRYTFVVTGEK